MTSKLTDTEAHQIALANFEDVGAVQATLEQQGDLYHQMESVAHQAIADGDVEFGWMVRGLADAKADLPMNGELAGLYGKYYRAGYRFWAMTETD